MQIIMEKILTPSALIIIDDNIVKTYTHPDTEFHDGSVNENVDAIWNHIKHKRILNMVVPDATTHITAKLGQYKNKKFESLKLAEALVIKTLGHRILADFYANSKNRPYPVRVFDCESKAVEWLRSVSQEPITN